MVHAATDHYRDIFREKVVDVGEGEAWLDLLTQRVPSNDAKALEPRSPSKELEGALDGMNRRKLPGIDGLPVEFFLTFGTYSGPWLPQGNVCRGGDGEARHVGLSCREGGMGQGGNMARAGGPQDLVSRNRDSGAEGVIRRVEAEVKGRVRRDIEKWGKHAALERWKGGFGWIW
ncbi:hypothetical protein NHX12_007108 [Muraenolepis orangiensis]|uniref:Uncharacterized protein n=1 Tax=Muraenolepis orangiensis TaxID=630683 RepID=A0A9Q0DQY6_9TELE|nr:hypothetical protein NHX12_007108 [Muraenolepis orangiensis]